MGGTPACEGIHRRTEAFTHIHTGHHLKYWNYGAYARPNTEGMRPEARKRSRDALGPAEKRSARDGDRLTATLFGHDFLVYLRETRLTEAKPG